MKAGLLTPSVWAPSSTSLVSMEGIGVSTGTPYAAVVVAEAMVSATTSTLSKKPFMGVPMAAETSSVVG